jgi:DNA-binding transcriptional LysR family regulator
VARPLAAARLGLYAARSYLREHGRPMKPADLARHRFIVFVEPRPMDSLVLVRGGKQTRVELAAVLTSNIGDVLAAMASEGLGIVAAPSFVVAAARSAGRIERVLEDWAVLPELTLWAIYPHRRFLSQKVRLFVEALRTEFGGDAAHDPWSDGPPSRRRAADLSATRSGR